MLSPEGYINYFISVALHLTLFFVTTTGRAVEKGFLFFSYATAYTCFSTLFNMLVPAISSMAGKVILAFVMMAILQVILYKLLLPPFRKVANYILKGWGKFYAVVLSFWALIVGQFLFTWMQLIVGVDKILCLLTIVAFCFTYIAIFNSMKNIVELSREKQKSLHTELLQSQVDAQSKEAALVRQNRHDMRHHYQELLSMALDGKTEQIIDYLKLQSESIETMTTDRFCENETINNILKVFHQKAAKQNITMEIRAAAKPDLSVPSPALVTVIANILENALHGTAESKANSPMITVSIKHKSGRLVISCENTCSQSLKFEEMPEYLQGIGIRSIISTAEKYNGSCRFSASDGVFRCTIIMDE
ncbi:MAG: GHKL domain-containing protein [Peptococcaceae bacterium]|nr:GHKL domain-containing protein [Peptococcaceae bacterium]